MTGEAWRTTRGQPIDTQRRKRTNRGDDEAMKVEESEERGQPRQEESEEVKGGKRHVEQSETAWRQQGD